ncbi:ATP-dependent DNA helicase UvrD2 [Tessaracoccus sp. OH4464_COT-324]|uniref:ATP-dependent DNA helicase UvrD2 n=1 Tax=Tessaracoccus sp. OH4464_COT-324 TaxID=2491059 RepID=UPI000F62C861|nr:ATP-dependent DNA helicase UvrD2 [Tessaracoccus sp. OH4464_COT-324]RRD47454.1 ATP-dependent DNA helicase [Tessaracoccus sp. OH4464_COT-324]
MDEILDALDPEQRQVALALDAPVVVLAGAGTGKTRAITHRVAYAVREGHYDPRAVLAVTFTTRAAGEMKTRLAQLGVHGTSARTIHAAALRQCRYFWPKAYGADFPELAENTFGLIARCASQVLGQTETALVRDLETEISWAKSGNVEPEAYAELAASREVAGASGAQVAHIMTLYEKAKQAQGVVDFHDLLLCNAALISSFPEIAEQVRGQYRHFVVDEYQDVSAIQHALICLWVDDRKDVCVVGDPNQAIHSFAGADPRFLRELARQHPGSTIRLVRNYRSSPEILALADHVLRPPSRERLRAMRPSGEVPEIRATSTAAHEAASVADWVVERNRAGTPWEELAILYRINASSPLIEAALDERQVPYSVRGTERFYERAEVRHAVGTLLRIAQEDPEATATQLLTNAYQELSWQPEAPRGQGRQRERWESLTALKQMIEAEVELEPTWSAGAAAAWLSQRASWQASPVASAVTLSTMHAAKGLEWDDVAVVGVREGMMPFALAKERAEIDEERRLLYVAITRARRMLRLSWNFVAQSGKHQRSRFLAGLNSNKRPIAAQQPFVQRSLKSASCRACGGQLSSAAERKRRAHLECDLPIDEGLFDALKVWRKATADEYSVPAFVVFTDATLYAIAEAKPSTLAELLALPGIGQAKAKRYGERVIELVNERR